MPVKILLREREHFRPGTRISVYALERTYSRQLAFLNRQHDNQLRWECDE